MSHASPEVSSSKDVDASHSPSTPPSDRTAGKRGFLVLFFAAWTLSLVGFALLAIGGRDYFRRHFALLSTGAVCRCNSFLAEKNYAGAEREARLALPSHPYDFGLRFLLVESLLAQKRPDDAYRELGEMESVSRIAKNRALLMQGFDLGRMFYLMARIDLDRGRLEQAVGHLLRTIDEATDYVDFAPKGETSLREFTRTQLQNRNISIDNMIVFSRVLSAMNEEPAARVLLGRIHEARPNLLIPLLIEAEMDLYGMAQTYTSDTLQSRIESARSRIDTVLASPNTPPAIRLWATLLRGGAVGNETRPVEPIDDASLDSLLGNSPVLVLKPKSFASPQGAANISLLRANIFRLGTVRSEFNLEKPAHSLWILARGSNAMGLWPYLVVKLDGREVGRLYLRLNAYRPYILPVEARAGKHTLELEFTNDEGEKVWSTDSNAYLRAAVWMP